MIRIPFNKPPFIGSEIDYVRAAVESGRICGDGEFNQKCHAWLREKTGTAKALLTTSCTHALEMAAALCNIQPGDEVIMPSFTFVSTADAFAMRGAKCIFVDIRPDTMNLDEKLVEAAITEKTRAIVPVHYAGCACDMDAIMAIAKRHSLMVVEDAAQAIDSFYVSKDGVKRALGSIGDMGCFSFHETKNIISGEGGMLAINDERLVRRAEIIWEKGTNRAEFYRGEVNKYGWVDTGSSFLPTEIVSAFLWAQLEHLDEIQTERKRLWNVYLEFMGKFGDRVKLPKVPEYATNNAHMFYLLFPDLAKRTDFIAKMKARDVLTVFHYLPLHSSEFYRARHDGRQLPNCDRYADTLVRLPLYCGLKPDQDKVLSAIEESLGS